MTIDLWALFLAFCVGFLLVFLLKKGRQTGAPSGLGYAAFAFFRGAARNLRSRLSFVPRYCRYIAFASFLLAFSNLQLVWQREAPSQPPPDSHPSEELQQEEIALPTEGLALYFVLDCSGSMREPMLFETIQKKRRQKTRLDVLKEVTHHFIAGSETLHLEGRTNDLLGVVSFARVPQVVCPLTFDHKTVLRALEGLREETDPKENGTAIGYALYKTTTLIQATKHFTEEEGAPYDIKGTVIILVTDGIQEVHPDDYSHARRSTGLLDAAKYARDAGVRIYVVNINPDLAHPQFARERDLLSQVGEMTGGKFYLVEGLAGLQEVYQTIDSLERVTLSQKKSFFASIRQKSRRNGEEENYHYYPLYPFFIALGLFALTTGIILESTWLRRTE